MARKKDRDDQFKNPTVSLNAIEDRQQQVFELHFVRGLDVGVIAEIFGVHRNTISNDLRTIRERVAKQVRDGDVLAAVGLHAALFDRIAQTAMVEFEKADGGRTRNGFLSTALSALDKKTRMLIDVGFLPHRRNEVDLRFSEPEEAEKEDARRPFSDLLKDPASRRRCIQFVEKIAGVSAATEIMARAAKADRKSVV